MAFIGLPAFASASDETIPSGVSRWHLNSSQHGFAEARSLCGPVPAGQSVGAWRAFTRVPNHQEDAAMTKNASKRLSPEDRLRTARMSYDRVGAEARAPMVRLAARPSPT